MSFSGVSFLPAVLPGPMLEFLLRLLRPGCWEVQPAGRGRKNGTRGIARGQSSVKLWEGKPALASYLNLHNPHRLSLL